MHLGKETTELTGASAWHRNPVPSSRCSLPGVPAPSRGKNPENSLFVHSQPPFPSPVHIHRVTTQKSAFHVAGLAILPWQVWARTINFCFLTRETAGKGTEGWQELRDKSGALFWAVWRDKWEPQPPQGSSANIWELRIQLRALGKVILHIPCKHLGSFTWRKVL